MKPVIFSTHKLHPDIERQLAELGELRIASAPSAEAIEAECKGAHHIVVRAPIPAEIVQRETQLHALVRHGAGLDMIPVETCTEAGIVVANVPGVNAVTVAEHAIWTLLALLRRFQSVNRDLRNKGWETARAHSNSGTELTGKTIGIIGFGNVGREVARIAHNGFNMNVLVHTRRADSVPEPFEAASLGHLLETADCVVLCCPLTDETRGILNSAAIARMRDSAVLVNVARGPVIETDALVEALRSGAIAGAALDVFDQHPLEAGHPLYELDNVILTPHMAGITRESMMRMGQGTVDEIARLTRREKPVNFVNPEVWPHFLERTGG